MIFEGDNGDHIMYEGKAEDTCVTQAFQDLRKQKKTTNISFFKSKVPEEEKLFHS